MRWKIAALMNRLPGQCWADLVAFALGDRRSPWQPVTWMCEKDMRRTGTCYCGKLRER